MAVNTESEDRERKRERWKSLKESMYCHILQSKQRFGLETQLKMNVLLGWVFTLRWLVSGIVFSTDNGFRFGYRDGDRCDGISTTE